MKPSSPASLGAGIAIGYLFASLLILTLCVRFLGATPFLYIIFNPHSAVFIAFLQEGFPPLRDYGILTFLLTVVFNGAIGAGIGWLVGEERRSIAKMRREQVQSENEVEL